jgi:hypothetical protein
VYEPVEGMPASARLAKTCKALVAKPREFNYSVVSLTREARPERSATQRRHFQHIFHPGYGQHRLPALRRGRLGRIGPQRVVRLEQSGYDTRPCCK